MIYKKHILVLLICLSINCLFAKGSERRDTTRAIKSGWCRNSRILSFGYGLMNNDFERMDKLRSTDKYSISSRSTSNPLYAKLEFFISRHLGAAMAVNFNRIKYNQAYSTTFNNQKTYNSVSVGYGLFTFNFRINYHILYTKKIDLYVGGGSGLRISEGGSTVAGLPDLYPSGFLKEVELTAGCRYLFNGKVGLYTEVGLTRSIFQAGLCYNFNR